jgi:hypothetical protein
MRQSGDWQSQEPWRKTALSDPIQADHAPNCGFPDEGFIGVVLGLREYFGLAVAAVAATIASVAAPATMPSTPATTTSSVAAASTAPTTVTAASTTATAASAFALRTGLVDHESAAEEFLAVQRGNGLFSFGVIFNLREAKTARLAGKAIA